MYSNPEGAPRDELAGVSAPLLIGGKGGKFSCGRVGKRSEVVAHLLRNSQVHAVDYTRWARAVEVLVYPREGSVCVQPINAQAQQTEQRGLGRRKLYNRIYKPHGYLLKSYKLCYHSPLHESRRK